MLDKKERMNKLKENSNPKSEVFYLELDTQLIEFKKSEVIFKNNIGYVKKDNVNTGYYYQGKFYPETINISCIVNDKFKAIIYCTGSYRKIDIFDDNNFILTKHFREEGHSWEESSHHKYIVKKDEVVDLRKLKTSYKKIDNSHIIETNYENDYVYMYDIVNDKVCSPQFTTIAEFDNEKIALATKTILRGSSSAELSCYIDITGKIVSLTSYMFNNEKPEFLSIPTEKFNELADKTLEELTILNEKNKENKRNAIYTLKRSIDRK